MGVTSRFTRAHLLAPGVLRPDVTRKAIRERAAADLDKIIYYLIILLLQMCILGESEVSTYYGTLCALPNQTTITIVRKFANCLLFNCPTVAASKAICRNRLLQTEEHKSNRFTMFTTPHLSTTFSFRRPPLNINDGSIHY